MVNLMRLPLRKLLCYFLSNACDPHQPQKTTFQGVYKFFLSIFFLQYQRCHHQIFDVIFVCLSLSLLFSLSCMPTSCAFLLVPVLLYLFRSIQIMAETVFFFLCVPSILITSSRVTVCVLMELSSSLEVIGLACVEIMKIMEPKYPRMSYVQRYFI